MKIAMPMDEKSMDAQIGKFFGRAPYFLIYDTVTNKEEFLDNSAVADQGGAGVRAAQVIVDRGIKALLTPQCGQNAEKILRAGEVLVYQSIDGSAKDNIAAYQDDKLSALSEAHPGFHNHG